MLIWEAVIMKNPPESEAVDSEIAAEVLVMPGTGMEILAAVDMVMLATVRGHGNSAASPQHAA